MNESEIIEFLKLLDAQVSKSDAEAKLKGIGEVVLYANKAGYLRLGIELLKCAFPETANDADLNYIFSKESEFGIEHLATTEEQFNDFYN